jgi:hypothetical protein
VLFFKTAASYARNIGAAYCCDMPDAPSLAASLVTADRGLHRNAIAQTLARFGPGALQFALDAGVAVAPLRAKETYREASPALARLGIDVDSWPAPPAGLFVVEERTVYIRSRSPMTVAHEFGHALDCALGGGVYRSGIDPAMRRLFAQARAFVTPYAATGIDEYFAEALRAYVEVNDPTSHWPRATKARLRKVDPLLYEYVEKVFKHRFAIAA